DVSINTCIFLLLLRYQRFFIMSSLISLRNFVFQATVILFFVAIKSIAQNNVGPCTCDLTQSACDVNCCCDADCSSADIQVFSGCSNDYSFLQTCFPSSIMFRNYTPYVINTSSGSGLSCIYYDNFTARNYYTNPQIENSNVTKVALRALDYSGYNLSAINPATDFSSYSSIYTAGNPILTVYNASGGPSYLFQPSAQSGSQFCGYSSPASFLTSGSSSCTRVISAETCATDPGIDLSGFAADFRVVPQPGFLTGNTTLGVNFTAMTPLTRGQVRCFLADGTEVTCTGGDAPSLNATVCSNVLTDLTYSLKYEQSLGIYEVSYDATLTEFNVGSPYSLKQTFTVAFNVSSSASTPTSRSGRPGYLAGKPVLAGSRNSTTGIITVNPDSRQWLTVPGASSGGACNDAAGAGRSVTYGEALLSSCSRQLTLTGGTLGASACSDANTAVRSSLDGLGISGDKVVGKFGDSVASTTSGWLQILVDSATCSAASVQQTRSGCVNALLGARLDLLTARTGSVTNPQNSIVGGKLTCVRSNITFQCSAGACSSGNFVQRYLTSYSVNFIDTSSTPTSNLTSPTSVFEMRLVKSFFYLLYVENGATPTAAAPQSFSTLICLLGTYAYFIAV
ncbi:hypothetical protein BOX15_Mlig010888g2, partial [Macrostomum lignano]